MNISVRLAKEEDVYEIRNLQKETWLATYPSKKEGISVSEVKEVFANDDTPEGRAKMEERKLRYKDPNLCTWVAETDGKIIGFCVGKKEPEYNRVSALYVHPDRQRKGIGRQLMLKTLEWLGKERGVLVNVATYNLGAISFYKKFGFSEAEEKSSKSEAAKLPCGKIIPEITLVRN